MKNDTKLRVPKKYEHMIDEIIFEKGNGYWVHLANGFYSPDSGCHTIHEMSQKEALKQIRAIKEEVYNLKEADGMYYEVDLSFEQAVERYKTTSRKQTMYSKSTGDRVDKIWDSKHLEREPRILLDEAIEDAENLVNRLAEVEELGCGGAEYILQGEEREQVEAQLEEIEAVIRHLEYKIEDKNAKEEEFKYFLSRMAKVGREILEEGHTKVEVNYSLEYLCVKHSTEDGEYFMQGDEYGCLYQDYSTTGCEEYMSFEEYLAYVSQSW